MSFAGPRPHFSPLETNSSSITPFEPEVHRHNSIQILRRRGHEHADTFLQRRQHFRSPNELWNVRRTDFFFAFGHHHQVHRHLFPRASDRMQRSKERRFRSFLIHRAAPDDHLAQRRFVHDSRFRRRRRPFRRIELFHVVHEIKPDCFRCARIERREYARFSVGVDHRRLLKSRIARQLRHVLRAFRISAILRRDRHLPDPILQPLHRLIMALRNFGFDCSKVSIRCVTI